MPPKENEMHQNVEEPIASEQTDDLEEFGGDTRQFWAINEPEDPIGNLVNGGNLNGDIDVEAIVDQTIANVFENGLDLDFILTSACPICGFRRKAALEMIVNKNGFFQHLKKGETSANPVVGVATMCQNCGHVDIFGYEIRDILFYLQGKGDKCHVENRKPYITGRTTDT